MAVLCLVTPKDSWVLCVKNVTLKIFFQSCLFCNLNLAKNKGSNYPSNAMLIGVEKSNFVLKRDT